MSVSLRRPPDARQQPFGTWLTVILGVALLARVAVILYAEHRPALFDFPDSHRYVQVARNIAAGLGPIDSANVRAGTDPLYPAMLAAGVWLGLDTSGADGYPAGLMRWGRIVNALCGVISMALLAAFARRLLGSDLAALVAAAILALDPILLFFNALVLTEAPHIVLLLAAFYCLIRAAPPIKAAPLIRAAPVRKRSSYTGAAPLPHGRGSDCLLPCGRGSGCLPPCGRGWAWAAAAGALLGLATLTRSSSLFLPLTLVPFVWHFSRRPVPGPNPPTPKLGTGGRLAATACFLLAAAAVLVPTIARNYGLFGRFVPVRTGNGASLMEALGPWADGGPGLDRIVYPSSPPNADECVRDQICRRTAIDWARAHPARAASLAWAKLRRTWSLTINAPGYSSTTYALIAWLTVGPEFALAAFGAWRLRRRPAALLLLLAVALYFTVVHLVFVGSVRYRIPAMPFLFVLAGVGVSLVLGDAESRWDGGHLARSSSPGQQPKMAEP